MCMFLLVQLWSSLPEHYFVFTQNLFYNPLCVSSAKVYIDKKIKRNESRSPDDLIGDILHQSSLSKKELYAAITELQIGGVETVSDHISVDTEISFWSLTIPALCLFAHPQKRPGYYGVAPHQKEKGNLTHKAFTFHPFPLKKGGKSLLQTGATVTVLQKQKMNVV